MARQNEVDEGISLNVETMPEASASVVEPLVGDIYRSRSGAAYFWWIVGVQRAEYSETAFYLCFSHRGKLTGTGRCGLHVLRDRPKAGHASVPPIEAEWF